MTTPKLDRYTLEKAAEICSDKLKRGRYWECPDAILALRAELPQIGEHKAVKLLRDLVRQIDEFCEKNGEADFYTGDANAYLDALSQSVQDDMPAMSSLEADEELASRNQVLMEHLPDEIVEWILHLDLHLTEHDDHHARLALRAAWPTVRDYFLSKSAAPAQTKAPEGMVLVPMVPTNDMFDAGFAQREKQHAAEQIDDMRESVFNIYHAMLAAAPSPTGNEESNT